MIRILLALVTAGALAAGAAAGPNPLAPVNSLPVGWSHAQINVVVKRQPHTYTYDRGRVQAVTPTTLTLRERDGVIVTVPVAATTRVRVRGRPGTLAQLRPRMTALTVSIDGAPAAVVRAG